MTRSGVLSDPARAGAVLRHLGDWTIRQRSNDRWPREHPPRACVRISGARTGTRGQVLGAMRAPPSRRAARDFGLVTPSESYSGGTARSAAWRAPRSRGPGQSAHHVDATRPDRASRVQDSRRRDEIGVGPRKRAVQSEPHSVDRTSTVFARNWSKGHPSRRGNKCCHARLPALQT